MTRVVYNLASASDGSNNIEAGKNEYKFLFGPNCISLRSTLVDTYGSSNKPSRQYAEPRGNHYGAARDDDPRFRKRLRRASRLLEMVRPQGTIKVLKCTAN